MSGDEDQRAERQRAQGRQGRPGGAEASDGRLRPTTPQPATEPAVSTSPHAALPPLEIFTDYTVTITIRAVSNADAVAQARRIAAIHSPQRSFEVRRAVFP